MATTDLVQFTSSPTSDGTSVMNRRKVETFIAGGAITANDAVSYDFSQADDGNKALYVVQSDSNSATASCFAGIALDTVAAGEEVRVVVRGIAEANVDGATAQGNLLQIGATAGQLAVRVVAVDEGGAATFDLYDIAAHACEADTSNVATVFVVARM